MVLFVWETLTLCFFKIGIKCVCVCLLNHIPVSDRIIKNSFYAHNKFGWWLCGRVLPALATSLVWLKRLFDLIAVIRRSLVSSFLTLKCLFVLQLFMLEDKIRKDTFTMAHYRIRNALLPPTQITREHTRDHPRVCVCVGVWPIASSSKKALVNQVCESDYPNVRQKTCIYPCLCVCFLHAQKNN